MQKAKVKLWNFVFGSVDELHQQKLPLNLVRISPPPRKMMMGEVTCPTCAKPSPTTSPSVSFGKGSATCVLSARLALTAFQQIFKRITDLQRLSLTANWQIYMKNIEPIACVLPKQTFWQRGLIVCHYHFLTCGVPFNIFCGQKRNICAFYSSFCFILFVLPFSASQVKPLVYNSQAPVTLVPNQ